VQIEEQLQRAVGHFIPDITLHLEVARVDTLRREGISAVGEALLFAQRIEEPALAAAAQDLLRDNQRRPIRVWGGGNRVGSPRGG
jgi:hypothetical protein